MRHRHLRSQRWSQEAVRSCLERGELVQWRGVMRAVGADPYRPIGTRLERALDYVQDEVHLREAHPLSYEGGIDSMTYGLWRGYLRDARSWRVAHPRDAHASQGS